MNEHKIGDFEVYVSDPYPAWVSIKYGRNEFRIHHNELADLEYAVQWAKREAKLKLKPVRDHMNEVDV